MLALQTKYDAFGYIMLLIIHAYAFFATYDVIIIHLI